MNELVWEGLLEILREGEPSLKASAHLWRRDDLNGSDWGGQLELPVVFRRLLPAEEYMVRLPSGAEARVRVAAGPSTTTMTFPTLTGIGHPPFGGAATPLAPAVEVEDEDEDEAPHAERPAPAPRRSAAEAPRSARERGARHAESPPRIQRAASTAREAAPAASPASATSEPRATSSPRPAPATAEHEAPALTTAEVRHPTPTPIVEAKPAGRATRSGTRARGDRPSPSGSRDSEGESVEQTEALARAFLAAVEARQAILPLEHGGFEGRAIAAARHDIEAIASILEGALRTPDGSAAWVDDLQSRLMVTAWFASLAIPDEQPDVAAAGQAAQVLLRTLEAVLAVSVELASGSAVPRAA